MEQNSQKQKRKGYGASEELGQIHIKRKKRHSEHDHTTSSPKPEDRDDISEPPSNESHLHISNPSKRSAIQKISSLIKSLQDVLEEDGLKEFAHLLDDESISKLEEVRNLMLAKFLILNGPESKSQLQQPVHHPRNVAKSMSGFTITPWTSCQIPTSLPKLPAVLDKTLAAGAFIHSGCGAGKINDLSYERLEWVGDAYLCITSTLLISQTFPSLLPGKSSQLRERLVKNLTLAEYARQYGFEQRAVLPAEIRGTTKHPTKDQDMNKILGDIFEAYVAAVVLSDPKDGVTRVSQWLKDLWGMTLRKEIITEETRGIKIDSPLWRLRGDTEPVEIISSILPSLSAKDQLRRAIGAKGVKIDYRDAAPEKKDKHSKLPLFTMGVYLDGWGEKDKQLGFGTALGKKEAGLKAAEMALGNKKLLKVYIEKKRLFDAQMELEREALKEQPGFEGT